MTTNQGDYQMKRILTAAAFAALTTTAFAAPPALPDGVYVADMSTYDFVTYQGGLYCDGGKCVGFKDGAIVTELPDILKHGSTNPRKLGLHLVQMPANGTYQHKYDWAKDGVWNRPTYAGRVHFTYTVDGGTRSDPTCTRTKVTADYVGPFDSPTAWKVKTTVVTLAGVCP